MRSHTGERPFPCDICNAAFITKGHLKNHMTTHNGTKPFVCTYPYCDVAFTRLARLKLHERTHIEE